MVGPDEANRLKARLATILIERIDQGEQEPIVDSTLIDYLIVKSKPLSAARRARGLLRYMTHPNFDIHQSINLTSHEPLIEAALGRSESTSEGELNYFLTYLTESGLIKDTTASDGGYIATVKGHELIELDVTVEGSKKVFVAMWFTSEMDEVWYVIKDSMERLGFEPVRVDLEKFDGLIDDKIVTEIREAKFVIADLTHGKDGHRGSVYYEAGFARGLNKHVIQTVREDHLDPTTPCFNVAFDLSHFPVITWSAEDLGKFEDDLVNRIKSRFSIST